MRTVSINDAKYGKGIGFTFPIIPSNKVQESKYVVRHFGTYEQDMKASPIISYIKEQSI